MKTYISAVKLLGSRGNFGTLMAVGANVSTQAYRMLEAEAQGLPIRMVPFTEDSVSCIVAADLVVCMAGYNTISEVLYCKKRALVVPRKGPSAEQRIRAELFGKRGLLDVLDPVELTPEVLANRVLACLRSDLPVPEDTLPMRGARCAAEHLLNLLQ
jgi:predicted glycosyltransferase